MLVTKLAEARARFVVRCVREAGEVAALADRLNTNPGALDRLCAQAHRLHGAAGSYGFGSVAGLARELELACISRTNVAARAGALADALRGMAV